MSGLIRLRGSAALAALLLTLLMGATCAGPTGAAPDAGGAAAVDTGLLLAVLVPPVILVSLGWLAYVFRLLFREPPEGPPSRKR
ncbi:MAG: hypothetical protein OXG33_00675 [Chloroflexi bacterium]|nr:hypothetical protein [Chloroflexota bacterium]